MLATPCELEDFAVGFSLAEGIVGSASEVYDVEEFKQVNGIELRLTIASSRLAALKTRRRTLAGRTGCGLCGIEALAQLAPIPRRVVPSGHLRSSSLNAALQDLADGQTLHRRTGAAHAAVFASWDGELRLLREDVGRHNALDKLVGALALRRLEAAAGFVLVTSRASYEMVQKTAAAGIGLLAALSAPTAMAVRDRRRCRRDAGRLRRSQAMRDLCASATGGLSERVNHELRARCMPERSAPSQSTSRMNKPDPSPPAAGGWGSLKAVTTYLLSEHVPASGVGRARPAEQARRLHVRQLRLGQAGQAARLRILRERRQGDCLGADGQAPAAVVFSRPHAWRTRILVRSRA